MFVKERVKLIKYLMIFKNLHNVIKEKQNLFYVHEEKKYNMKLKLLSKPK